MWIHADGDGVNQCDAIVPARRDPICHVLDGVEWCSPVAPAPVDMGFCEPDPDPDECWDPCWEGWRCVDDRAFCVRAGAPQ